MHFVRSRASRVLALTLFLVACAAPTTPAVTPTPFTGTPRAVIIDTDMAQDDWLAILYLLQRPEVVVQAITVTGAGEAHCGQGVQQALGLVALAGQPDIPVACGRETPLAGDHVFPSAWREDVDSWAGRGLPANPNPSSDQSAVELIAATVAAASAPPTILALGPLTNLAEAFQADPALAGQLAMVYIMGGAVEVDGNVGVSGVGIENQFAEWNFFVDPTAAAVVVRSGAPLTLVPLDATNDVPVTTAFYERLKARRTTPVAEYFYNLLTQQPFIYESNTYSFWDSLAAAVLVDESLVTIQSGSLTVVVDEGPDSGRVTTTEGGAPARYASSADQAAFEAALLDTLNATRP